MLFSKKTGGVYDAKIHKGAIPDDALDIPEELYEAFKMGEFSRFDVAGGIVVRYSPAAPTRAELVAEAWHGIKTERDRRKAGGVKIGAKWFHSDDGSRIQQMGLVMMGANLPAGLQWKTMDGSFITMTPALAQQVFTGQAASDQAIFAVAEQHRVAMEASADPASYDYSTGWPKIFGE